MTVFGLNKILFWKATFVSLYHFCLKMSAWSSNIKVGQLAGYPTRTGNIEWAEKKTVSHFLPHLPSKISSRFFGRICNWLRQEVRWVLVLVVEETSNFPTLTHRHCHEADVYIFFILSSGRGAWWQIPTHGISWCTATTISMWGFIESPLPRKTNTILSILSRTVGIYAG